MDIFKYYSELEQGRIILSFKGKISEEFLSSVYQTMENHFEEGAEDIRLKKKIYYILIECLQNVFHHTGNLNDENGKSDFEGNDNAIFMISKSLADNYVITTGNFIPEKKISALKDRIDSINKMSKEELKALYLDQLNSTELSEKGGAGLGIIDIARKSGSKLNYSFHSVNPETSFFTLSIEIK